MRRRMKLLTIALLAGLLSGLAAPQPARAGGDGDDNSGGDVEALITEWQALNDTCRGGSGDDPDTMKACDSRDDVTTKLNDAGWCYGHDGQAEYQREWEACE